MIVFYGISIILFLIYACLIVYYRQSWMAIPEFNANSSPAYHHTRISVIIPARNEEDNIGDCLNSIVQQNYRDDLYEVIVVDDHSTDRTAEIINSYHTKNIKLISLKDFTGNKLLNSYKKMAISTAIEHATGSLIVTTDADCILPPAWLETIAAFYETNHPAFIAVPVAYYNETSFLDIFQSLDFMTLQGITGASVFKKFHSMCNGANLAYEKKIFEAVGGFSNINNIASGDDMLLMHKISRHSPGRVKFLKSTQAIVKTRATGNMASFINQRIRWASKADKYEDKRIFFVLLLVYIFNLWLIVLAIGSFFNYLLGYCLLAMLLLKTITEIFFIYPVAGFFSKEKLLWWFPAAQPFHILYTVVAGWLGKFGSYRWKERKVQ